MQHAAHEDEDHGQRQQVHPGEPHVPPQRAVVGLQRREGTLGHDRRIAAKEVARVDEDHGHDGGAQRDEHRQRRPATGPGAACR